MKCEFLYRVDDKEFKKLQPEGKIISFKHASQLFSMIPIVYPRIKKLNDLVMYGGLKGPELYDKSMKMNAEIIKALHKRSISLRSAGPKRYTNIGRAGYTKSNFVHLLRRFSAIDEELPGWMDRMMFNIFVDGQCRILDYAHRLNGFGMREEIIHRYYALEDTLDEIRVLV